MSVQAQPEAVAQARAPRVVSFGFQSPPGCGSAQRFAERAGARLAEVRFVDRGEASSVHTTLERQGQRVRAELVISLDGGRRLRRALLAQSCDQALDAIAFVAAVALDPDAKEPIKVSDEPALASPAAEEPADPLEQAEDARQDPLQERSGLDSASEREPQATTSGAGADPEWRIGAAGVAVPGPAPEPLWGGGLLVGWFAGGGGWWAPSLELGLDATFRGGIVQAAGTAEFALYRASLELCPSRGDWDRLWLRWCGHAEGAALLARGRDTFAPESAVRPWFAAGVSLEAELALGQRFGLFVGGTAEFPFIRDSFQFDDQRFHRVPALVGSVRAGVAVRFP